MTMGEATRPRSAQRLSIIVPYRDRAEQLARFLLHMTLYFRRDKIDRHQPYRILLVEQEAGRPFNIGALRNIGFLLSEAESEQVCFHDVDYLPIWADYRPVERPTRLLWHGAEKVPIRDSTNLFVNHDRKKYFSGVVMFPAALFRQLNGYSNSYWGWGYEDTDMRIRCRAERIGLGYRDGTFEPLRHASNGYLADGKPSETHQTNRALCQRNSVAIHARNAHREEGLNSLRFEILARGPLTDGQGQPYPHTERVLVRI
jgi:N-terminal domain of galactosyltransferase/N-terminal region of glycosyl transferase group 7